MSGETKPESCLLAPMEVEALAVGTPGGRWTDLHPDFSLLYQGKILGSQVTPALFRSQAPKNPPAAQGRSKAPLRWWEQPGIHLHWTLPEALTRGRQRPSSGDRPLEAPEFPLIPNRWMVQRIWRKQPGNEVSVKAWVVESDYLHGISSDSTKIDAVPFPRLDGPALFDFAGKAFEYGSWTEQQREYRIPVTALGFGDPAFAAYYPDCRTLLGLYDPLTDVENETRLTYLVTGWYSDPAKDILRSFTPSELQWACSADANALPSRTLCHGTIYNIQWKSRGFTYNPSIPKADSKSIRVSVGNNTTEAVAALLSEELANPNVEPLLAAFEEDQLARTSDLLELGSLLHERRFGALSGGIEFTVQKKQSDGDQSSAAGVTLPEALEELLMQLNAAEREFERRLRQFDGLRWELYATWCKWARLYTDSQKEPAALSAKLNTLKRQVADESTAIASLKQSRDRSEQTLRDTVGRQFADLEVASSPAASFWLANDPVVLVSAPGLLPSRAKRTSLKPEEEQLPCRISGQELSGFTVDIPGGETGIQLQGSGVFRIAGDPFPGGGAKVPAGVTDRLLYEALLLDPFHAGAIAEQAYVQAKLQARPEMDQLIEQIKKAQRAATTRPATPRPMGSLPSPAALTDWERNPWRPLFLEWRVAWYPSAATVPDALKDWTLPAEESDYRWKGAAPNLSNASIYEGCSILNPYAVRNLQSRLSKYNEDRHDPDLARVVARLDQMPVLGQALGGFTDALIQRDQCLQIAPINPAIFAGKDESRRDGIMDLIDGANSVSPIFDPQSKSARPFLPVRAGHMKVLALSIVDAFGQTLDIETINVPIRAASLRTDGQNTGPLLQFPPRIAQPLRLRFDWTATANPAGTYPVKSPVCGWVIHNHLDKNLSIYDASGAPWGALQRILRVSAGGGTGGTANKDDKAFFWTPMPGTGNQPESIVNPHLRNFVRFVHALGADAGAAFWNLLDEALARTDPGQPEDDPMLSLLLGRPLRWCARRSAWS